MPQRHVLDAVLRAARSLPGYPDLRVLDVSAGRGEIAAALAREGAAVRGTHFRADDYKLADASRPLETGTIPIDADVDLTRPLPYPDAAFDLVVFCEVAEHLPSYIPAVLEIGRVLAPGGHVILSTPNVGRMHSRWRFFWTGTHKLIRRRVGWDLAPDDLYAYHISPVDLPLLHTLLHQAGLGITGLGITRWKAKHAWLLAAYPLVWLATRLETSRHRAGPEHARGENDLFRWMVSLPALVSEQLLLTARKGRPGPEAPGPRPTRSSSSPARASSPGT